MRGERDAVEGDRVIVEGKPLAIRRRVGRLDEPCRIKIEIGAALRAHRKTVASRKQSERAEIGHASLVAGPVEGLHNGSGISGLPAAAILDLHLEDWRWRLGRRVTQGKDVTARSGWPRHIKGKKIAVL